MPTEKDIAHLKILLVEDNHINQMVVEELLKQGGAGVCMVDNGVQCLEKMASGTFDAVLMDIRMPEMDGYEATRQLRQKGVDLPVIAMTAHATVAEKEKCRDAGMDAHLSKPVDPDALYDTLLALCPGESAGRARPRAGLAAAGPAPAGGAGVLPREMDGIDMKEGLSRLGGNRALYLELLLNFRRTYGGVIPEFLQTLDDRNPEATVSMVHTLKGMAGNLGASGLFRAADAVEIAAGREELDRGHTLVRQLTTELNRVIDSLANLKPARKTEPVQSGSGLSKPLDMEIAGPLLASLEWYLKSDLVAAMDTVEKLETCLAGTAAAPTFNTLKAQVRSFDMEDALETLSRLSAEVLNL